MVFRNNFIHSVSRFHNFLGAFVFKTVLVANRGEVAERIRKTCHRMGIRCLALATEADKDLQFLQRFDDVLLLKDRRGYLDMASIVSLAKANQVAAIHPGWGFLSENPTFASMVEAVGITFVGPTAPSMRRMADKARARDTMTSLGLMPIPGVDGILKDADHALSEAARIRYPVLLKAVAGGGGRGMRRVFAKEEMMAAFQSASAEASSAFGNGAMYMEKLITRGRHIEFQVLSDGKKAVVLGERECSIQRRHQKLLEETPSLLVGDEQRIQLQDTISRVCVELGYRGAGTVEMLGDADGSLYFMEMNTRLQVEHTITEEVTGLDLVEHQLRIAANEPLNVAYSPSGHSIQCRINAEDSTNNFQPRPGQISTLRWPKLQGLRVDTHLVEGDSVSPHYDSMIAKVIVSADTRSEAITKMEEALAQTIIEGVPTTIPVHQQILKHPQFQTGHYDTNFLENLLNA